MELREAAAYIREGNTALGIELGSTRIKAVLTAPTYETIATGSFAWENKLQDGVWTYPLEEVWQGIAACYGQLAAKVRSRYHVDIERIGAIGVSAMMHGYLAFDKDGRLLVPFRTWRNAITEEAAAKLSKLFQFNIPQRWSIAHLYQAMLNDEPHVKDIASLTTLAGYVHEQLSGEHILGVGDASGMFPLTADGAYDKEKLSQFSVLVHDKGHSWQLEELLPAIRMAGESAGQLTAEGAKKLDPSGHLQAGALMAPPEGDAGTGMVSTNAVRPCTGNISVGTSAFSMNVLEKPLSTWHQDIDVVATPDGAPVAMVHVNNCSSDLNAWVELFREFADYLGTPVAPDELYKLLLVHTAKGDADAGGIVNYSCLSGENITRLASGRPLCVRMPHSHFNLPNFMLAQLYGAFAPLKIGMDILMREEKIRTDAMVAQGGLFRTPVIAQQVLANALNLPITVMDTASEGGPWGMAVLAWYTKLTQAGRQQTLADFLDEEVFKDAEGTTLMPEPAGVRGCEQFIARYRAALPVEQLATEKLADTEEA